MELQLIAESKSLDPRAQWLMERQRSGRTTAATSSTEEGETAVIALVSEPEAWSQIAGVFPGAVLGRVQDGDGWIVTGRVQIADLERVRADPTVLSLKAPQAMHEQLGTTLPEVEATQELLPPDSVGNFGAQAIVGIVDHGCDFAHRNFRNADGTTRILAIWDQFAPARANSPLGYGRVHERDEIDAALANADPYVALGYGPWPKEMNGTHGTHVTDIAAGNGLGTGLRGVASQSDIIFAELATSDIAWFGENVLSSGFGDSTHLLEAMNWIFQRAGDRPCVINVSLGTNGGPHYGTSLVEKGIDALITNAPNRAVVIAASNSFGDGIHAAGNVAQGSFTDLHWELPRSDTSPNELEVWYAGADRFSLEVISPTKASLGRVNLGESKRAVDSRGVPRIVIAHRAQDPNNGDNLIGVFLEADLPIGTWTLRLHGEQVSNGGFHAWIERNDAGQSHFAAPCDSSHTLGSISCGRFSIAVGSYDAHQKTRPLSAFTSAGPTRDGREKPEVSAPGQNVFAARSQSVDGIVRKSGTSMAAPAVAGMTALFLSEARGGT